MGQRAVRRLRLHRQPHARQGPLVPEDDLCRDWEATVFADGGPKFTSDRIRRLLDCLATFPGDTLQARIEAYARSCGVTDEEIAAFRRLMLESPKEASK